MTNDDMFESPLLQLVDLSIKAVVCLEEQFMTVADVRRKLGITRRQIYYWDFKGLKYTKKKTAKRAWRKFAIIDLWWFAILRDLLKFGMKLEQCKHVFNVIRSNVIDSLFFIYHLAEDDPIFLLVNFEGSARIHFGYLIETKESTKPWLVVPLNSTLRQILLDTQTEDFYVEQSREKSDGKRKLIFFMSGKRREYQFSNAERKHILECEPSYYAKMGLKCTTSGKH